MNVYTLSEAQQNLPMLLERALIDGEIQIKYRMAGLFALKPVQPSRSPLDIVGVDLNLSRDEIVDVVREMRERHY